MIETERDIINWLLNPDEPVEESKEKLVQFGLDKILNEIELPLMPVLKDMYERGVGLDSKFLGDLRKKLSQQIEDLIKKIYQYTGEFNINSPKQLSVILFDKLKIVPRLKSTAAGQLELIKDKHPVISLILNYREIFKAQSTYVEPLLGLGETARTTFLQTGTATGRLSSKNPNLQNIPDIIRPAFVARAGYVLASFDYSQIELRVLATVANDKKMIEAFQNDLDIHKLTASQVFNVPLEKVTSDMRQLAKTLNFGVVYGMGPSAFARASGLSRQEAEKFIAEYFNNFAQIRDWQEKVKNELRQKGYVENLNGRKRWLPIEAERAAINMPIQSLAADIIKIAMIQTNKYRLLLSIHDELLFEIEDDKVKDIVNDIKNTMESVYHLSVPLKVNVKIGCNWGEMKSI